MYHDIPQVFCPWHLPRMITEFSPSPPWHPNPRRAFLFSPHLIANLTPGHYSQQGVQSSQTLQPHSYSCPEIEQCLRLERRTETSSRRRAQSREIADFPSRDLLPISLLLDPTSPPTPLVSPLLPLHPVDPPLPPGSPTPAPSSPSPQPQQPPAPPPQPLAPHHSLPRRSNLVQTSNTPSPSAFSSASSATASRATRTSSAYPAFPSAPDPSPSILRTLSSSVPPASSVSSPSALPSSSAVFSASSAVSEPTTLAASTASNRARVLAGTLVPPLILIILVVIACIRRRRRRRLRPKRDQHRVGFAEEAYKTPPASSDATTPPEDSELLSTAKQAPQTQSAAPHCKQGPSLYDPILTRSQAPEEYPPPTPPPRYARPLPKIPSTA
ncbi:hypothetical protein FB451DRAFT_1409595 [Mycena latifolia]|nr:hypothetical protein FB451DRAFT_1409595 [Mycena latifolia]